MNRYAGLTLTFASMFLWVMAILVNSPPLFYMATAVLATMGASHLQAWLAVRALRLERITSPAVRLGEPVTVEITVWSERRIKRPLVTVEDGLPRRLVTSGETPSLPVAPSFDQPIRTRYTFRPMRRGRYRWSTLTVTGTDALGLVQHRKTYVTDPVELTVYPAPLPVLTELNPMTGWGAADLDSGRIKGAGLEPRGVREYSEGDPLRYVHWRSSARTGRLMVKEFETGSGVTMLMILQRTEGTDVGNRESSTFEAMCGHALYLAGAYMRKGATIYFPNFESFEAAREHPEARERAVRDVLTDIQPNSANTLAEDIDAARSSLKPGSTLVAFCAIQDAGLIDTLSSLTEVQKIVLVYDTSEYSTARLTDGRLPAADPVFLSRLEAAGAQVIVMPKVERLI